LRFTSTEMIGDDLLIEAYISNSDGVNHSS
jgi:hypothetical protein